MVDSSAIVSLIVVGGADLLQLAREKLIVPVGVYEELILSKKARAHPNRVAVQPLFATRTLNIARLAPTVEGVSTDRQVAHLAVENRAAWILSDDEKLGRRAARLGLVVLNTPGFLFLLLKRGLLLRRRYNSLVINLCRRARITAEVRDAYLSLRKPR